MRPVVEGQLASMLDAKLVKELLDAHEEAKRNFQVSVDAVKELLEACKQIDGSLS